MITISSGEIGMQSNFPSTRLLVRFVFAIAIVAGFSVLFILLRESLPASVVALLYLIPVVISTSLWGLIAGIVTSVVSFLTYNYFFLSPFYTLHVARPQDFLVMIVLLGVSIFISSLMANVQGNLEKVEAREREALQLYKLSLDLTGQRDQAAIADILARRIHEFFQGCIIEVEVGQPGQKIKAIFPTDPADCLDGTPRQIPLTSQHGQLGVIRIGGLPDRIPPEEERLLQTFANQGALALDAVILSASETRAKILEESDRLKTAILSSVSHELRTPLATIQTAATSLFNSNLNLEKESRSELEGLLLEETDHMIQLVGNLLNMSRIEAGALKLQRQWNSLAEIIDMCMKRLERISSGHKILVNVSDDLPFISVDSVLMEQVIINLVSNSLKYAPAHTPIEISAGVEEDQLVVTVSNQGPAIPQEYLEHIFEKFYPIPGPEQAQGVGLGLSICKGIVEAHEGKIWAEDLSQGVAFRFTLPLGLGGAKPMLPEEAEEE